MNENRKISFLKLILGILIIIGLIFFLVVKSRFSIKSTERKPEIEPTDAGTENNRKPTVDPAIFEFISGAGMETNPEIKPENVGAEKPADFPAVTPAFSAQPQPEIQFDQFPLTKNVGKITPSPLERKLTLTEAVEALKNLGFGKTAAYAALTPNGRFSAWLRFTADGKITWTDLPKNRQRKVDNREFHKG
jgi:hypothetical protein